MATSPLPSRGSTSGWNCSVTPAFLGVPGRGDKIRSGYITPAFSGVHTWAELLRNPCVLEGPQKRGSKSKCTTSPLPSFFGGGVLQSGEWGDMNKRQTGASSPCRTGACQLGPFVGHKWRHEKKIAKQIWVAVQSTKELTSKNNKRGQSSHHHTQKNHIHTKKPFTTPIEAQKNMSMEVHQNYVLKAGAKSPATAQNHSTNLDLTAIFPWSQTMRNQYPVLF